MHSLALALSLLVVSAAPDTRGSKAISYSRSGGWRGMKQELMIQNVRSLTYTEDGIVKDERALKPGEAARINQLLRAARKSEPAPDKALGKLPDGFQIHLAFDGAEKPVLIRDTLTFPPQGAGVAWDALVKQLDTILEQELKGHAPAKKK